MLFRSEKRRYRIIPVIEGLVFLAAVYFICGLTAAAALFIGIIVEEVLIIYLRKNLGGFSGDVSGAAITAGELACLIALAFI